MLKQEWKSLFHNKILLLVVIVIALIPAIYAGLFLASMWDPYGNVDKLPRSCARVFRTRRSIFSPFFVSIKIPLLLHLPYFLKEFFQVEKTSREDLKSYLKKI